MCLCRGLTVFVALLHSQDAASSAREATDTALRSAAAADSLAQLLRTQLNEVLESHGESSPIDSERGTDSSPAVALPDRPAVSGASASSTPFRGRRTAPLRKPGLPSRHPRGAALCASNSPAGNVENGTATNRSSFGSWAAGRVDGDTFVTGSTTTSCSTSQLSDTDGTLPRSDSNSFSSSCGRSSFSSSISTRNPICRGKGASTVTGDSNSDSDSHSGSHGFGLHASRVDTASLRDSSPQEAAVLFGSGDCAARWLSDDRPYGDSSGVSRNDASPPARLSLSPWLCSEAETAATAAWAALAAADEPPLHEHQHAEGKESTDQVC